MLHHLVFICLDMIAVLGILGGCLLPLLQGLRPTLPHLVTHVLSWSLIFIGVTCGIIRHQYP